MLSAMEKTEQGMGESVLREEVGQDAILSKAVRVDLIEEGWYKQSYERDGRN